MKINSVRLSIAAATALALINDATAVTKSWKDSAGSGNWSNGSNWSSDSGAIDTPPAAGDTVYIAPTDGASRTISYNVSAPPLAGFIVDLNGPGASRTTFNMAGGNLTNTGFIVGGSGRATFNQSGGTHTQSDPAFDGAVGYVGGDGVYNLSGSGALSMAKDLYVGMHGASEGTFNQAGGTVTIARDLLMARDAGSSGFYTIVGGTLSVGRELSVGDGGLGRMTIQGGGDVTAVDAYIADASSSTGAVSVRGAGSTWTNNNLSVGYLGYGTLIIADGGSLHNVRSYVGHYGGSTGFVSVTGAGSTWTNSQGIQIGYQGAGSLDIFDGGSVIGTGGGIGGDVEVVGAGSRWINSNQLSIGYAGGGKLSIGAGAEVTGGDYTNLWSDGSMVLQGGAFTTKVFNHHSGGSFAWTSGALHVEEYIGDFVNLINQGGVLAPGQSAGATNVQGNYKQLPAGALEIEIGGTGTATQFDFVNITGVAQLGGELQLKLINGFTPLAPQKFTVLVAGSIQSFFSNAGNGQRVDTVDGLGSFVVHYGPTSDFNPNQIVLSDFQPSLNQSGDFDLDGDVDGADFLKWQRGESPRPLSPLDLSNWRNGFGDVAPTAGSVPEPAAVILLATAALLSLLKPDRETARLTRDRSKSIV